MKGENLLDLIGKIDDKFIEEIYAEEKIELSVSFRAFWKPILVAALFLVFIVGILPNFTKEEIAKDPEVKTPPLVIENEKEIDENLPTIAINEVFSDGMGYSGISLYSLEDLENGNPWRENWNIKTLPVYKNKYLFSHGYIAESYTKDDMEENIVEIGKLYNLDLSNSEFVVIPYSDYEVERYMEDKDIDFSSLNLVAEVKTSKNGYNFSAERSGGVRVTFDDANVIYTSEALNITDIYENDGDKLKVSEFLIEKYPHLLGLENPKAYLDPWLVTPDFYSEKAEEIDDFMSYQLGRKVSFLPSIENNVYGMDYNMIDLGDKVGDYPLMSVEEAKNMMAEEKFITNVPYEYPGVENIRKVELSYFISNYQEYIIPYYEFYVEIPEETKEEGKMSLGLYLVPAIEQEYLDMPVYDGRFN